ncbi:MAG: ATP-binding cassette domain-containing protein [Cyanobacteria bacterium P01_H01_bin.15]
MLQTIAPSKKVIEVRHLDHFFGKGNLRKQTLFDLSFDLAVGEIVIMSGPSGSGKTTLLTLLGGLRSAQSGSLRVLGQELCVAPSSTLVCTRRHNGYIFQAHNLHQSLTAIENVMMSLELQAELSRSQMREKAADALSSVGLADRIDYYPANLSGGQKQRVAIARALASEPAIVLADEPTAALDSQSGRDVVDLLQKLARENGTTVLIVTHDNRILDIGDRLLHLEDGRLCRDTQKL